MFTFSQWNSVDSIISRRKLTIIIIIMKIFGIHCELKEKKRSKVYFFSLMHFQIFFAFFSVLNCLSLGWKLFCENLYTRFLFWTPCWTFKVKETIYQSIKWSCKKLKDFRVRGNWIKSKPISLICTVVNSIIYFYFFREQQIVCFIVKVCLPHIVPWDESALSWIWRHTCAMHDRRTLGTSFGRWKWSQ